MQARTAPAERRPAPGLTNGLPGGTLSARPILRAGLAAVTGAAALLSASLSHAEDAPAATAPQADATSRDAAPDAPGAPVVRIMPVPPVNASQWRFTLAPYLWMSSLKSTVSFSPPIGSTSVITSTIDTSFNDLLSVLKFAVMTEAEARRGRFSLDTDFIYVSVAQSGSRVHSITGPQGGELGVGLNGELKVKNTFWTLDAGYDVVRNDHSYLQLFGGFRYLGVDTSLDWTRQPPLADLPKMGKVTDNTDEFDGIAGARGELGIGESRWKLVYYGDVGAGGSKLTWQVSGKLAYAERWGDFGIGWRYLDYEQGSDKHLQNLSMSGPILFMHYTFG